MVSRQGAKAGCWSALCLLSLLAPTLGFQMISSGLKCLGPGGPRLVRGTGPRNLGLRSLGLRMYEGDFEFRIKRSFGEQFFFEAQYTNEEKAKAWTFRRTWSDFARLDRFARARNEGLPELPPKPYLIGEEASFEPFQNYFTSVLAIPGIIEEAEVYEFVQAPSSVLVAAMPGKVPIDVEAKGKTRYKGETDKYAVPVMDPVMLAEQAGRGVKDIKSFVEKEEIVNKVTDKANERIDEWNEVTSNRMNEWGEVISEAGEKVDTKAAGKSFGSVIANLKSGRGLFGEEATTKVAKQAMGIENYSADEKWEVRLVSPDGMEAEDLEVTIRPTQTCGRLLKAWIQQAGLPEDSIAKFGIKANGKQVEVDSEIGASGVSSGGALQIVKL